MALFHSISAPLPPIPDDLSIPQFILSTNPYPLRPIRPPTVPWLIHDDTGRAVYHSELFQRTRGLANAFSIKWGIKSNDVVCLFSPNNIDYPVSVWATQSLGAIVTPANPGYTAEELASQLSATKAKLVITHPAFLNTTKSAMQETGIPLDRLIFIEPPETSDDPYLTLEQLVQFGLQNSTNYQDQQFKPGEAKTALAFLSFSSGTTGKPKAVAIPHYSVIANVVQMATHFRIYDPAYPHKRLLPGDIAAAVLPFFHIYGLVLNLHFLLFSGLSLVVIPKFHFPAFLKNIVRHRITHLFVVPPIVVLMCKHPLTKEHDLNHVKYVMCGAAPLSGELVGDLSKLLPSASIGQGYGLTETCTTVAIFPPHHTLGTIGSAGQLIPGVIAKVVKSDGTLATEGEQGELVVAGPSMAIGYMNNEAATRETFIDGWVRTGDEVIIRNNDLFIVDRLKEIMKVRGFQVAPAELEGHLLTHPDVADACVVPVADDFNGEVPLAYIVLSEEAVRRISGNGRASEDLKAAIAKHVVGAKVHYKHLSGGVVFIKAIPKNSSGKILRRVLREQAKKLKAGKLEVQGKL